jgi:beta-glucuronidase
MQDGIWHGLLEVIIHNTSTQKVSVQLKSTLAQYEMVFDTLEIQRETEMRVSLKQAFPDVTSWSHETPKLYSIHTILCSNNKPIDDLIERVGFRTIKIDGTKIQVNGKNVFLKGFNRHEDYATVGCAIPLQLMVQDMDIMQDMGVNALRTCHYPNDERFLDLCDERGILVWEENHARGLLLEDMQNPNFDQQCKDCISEMIENHYNHPSIIIWGILNECAAETPEGREKYKTQYEQIRRLDHSRPTTSATCRHFTDITLDLPDIVSFNMYSGWYIDVPIQQRNEQEIEWIKNAGGEGKPIIVSEFGAAALYGYRDRSRCKWSEERQADIIEESLDVYMNDENITGVFIWQFADCRVTEEGPWFATRARCHNNKGVVDEYRRPKIAYDIIKEKFNKH